jgi:tetratricopeptide (TPR) repeat protein
MRMKLRSIRAAISGSAPTALALAALALTGCSETLTGHSARVAEIAPDTTGATTGNIASLTDVIKRNPDDSVAYNTRGIAYAKALKFQDAIRDFTKAIQLDPHFAGAYTNRALAYRQIEKDGPALADFNAAIVANPNDAAAYLGRGNLLRSQGHYPEALEDLNAAIRLNPEGAQAYHARGLIYQRQGDYAQAITDFNNAIDRDPFAGAPYQARGQSLLATGKYDAAIEDFNAALNVDPNNADAWASLGLAYEKQGNRPKARESYERAMEVSPNNPMARAGLQRLAGAPPAHHRVALSIQASTSGIRIPSARWPPPSTRMKSFGSWASANNFSASRMGTALSRVPCTISSGAKTRAMRSSLRNPSLISARTGNIQNSAAATSAIDE